VVSLIPWMPVMPHSLVPSRTVRPAQLEIGAAPGLTEAGSGTLALPAAGLIPAAADVGLLSFLTSGVTHLRLTASALATHSRFRGRVEPVKGPCRIPGLTDDHTRSHLSPSPVSGTLDVTGQRGA
jgi:hypothetical protein